MLCECGCGQITPIIEKTEPRKGYVRGNHRRFLSGHNNRTRWAAYDREAVFRSGLAPPDENGCLVWLGRIDRKGYGRFEYEGRKNLAAYRVALMLIGRSLAWRSLLAARGQKAAR